MKVYRYTGDDTIGVITEHRGSYYIDAKDDSGIVITVDDERVCVIIDANEGEFDIYNGNIEAPRGGIMLGCDIDYRIQYYYSTLTTVLDRYSDDILEFNINVLSSLAKLIRKTFDAFMETCESLENEIDGFRPKYVKGSHSANPNSEHSAN